MKTCGMLETMNTEITYIYGKHALTEVLTMRPDLVLHIHTAPDFTDARLIELSKRAGIPRGSFDPKKMPKGVPPDAVHQGILGLIDTAKLLVPYETFITALTVTPHTGLIVLGEVQDPQNVGSIIRSAAAFGISGILIPEHRQAPITGAVIKVSAGMAFRIPLVRIGNVNHTLEDLKSHGFWTYGLEQTGSVSAYEEGFEKASVFVVGNEADGVREKTLLHCDIPLMIPMDTRAESLNAAVATAVVLSHWSAKHPPRTT